MAISSPLALCSGYHSTGVNGGRGYFTINLAFYCPLDLPNSVHNSKHYWERPNEYDPERWLQSGINAEHALPAGAIASGSDNAKASSQGRAEVAGSAGIGGPAGLDDGSRALRFMPFGLVSHETLHKLPFLPIDHGLISRLMLWPHNRVSVTASARTKARPITWQRWPRCWATITLRCRRRYGGSGDWHKVC